MSQYQKQLYIYSPDLVEDVYAYLRSKVSLISKALNRSVIEMNSLVWLKMGSILFSELLFYERFHKYSLLAAWQFSILKIQLKATSNIS